MVTTLILVTLATLVLWDGLRRLLPVHVPAIISRAICVGLALILLTWATHTILIALASVGALMIIGTWVSVEPVKPWGVYLTWAWHRVRKPKVTEPGHEARPDSKLGHRIPSL